MKSLQSLILAVGAAFMMVLSVQPSVAAERAVIVLDGSGSMWAQIDGKARITIARETLRTVLKGLPDDLELGLLTYGHRTKGDCGDIEMLVAPAVGTADAIAQAADGINPKGKTPISAAVTQAAEALHFTEDKATVILITDGLETCEADPCALASDLENKGLDFTTHVVGFGLTEEEGKQVACLAENTGGKYFQASDADGLADALTTTVAAVSEPAPEPAPTPEPAKAEFNFTPEIVMLEGGDPLPEDADVVWEFRTPGADGAQGEWIRTEYGGAVKLAIEPGTYDVIASLGAAKTTQTLTFTDEVAKPLFVLNAGQLIIHPYANEGEPVSDAAAVHVEFADGESTTTYGDTKHFVPAGDQTVTVSLGNGKSELTLSVAAGQTVEQDVVLGTGHVVINALYAEGMAVEEGGMGIKILAAKKDLQGNREEVSYGYGPGTAYDLPPGDYVAVIDLQAARAEQPFTVKSGDSAEVVVMLDAGVLSVTAPAGTERIEVFLPKKDIQGNRQQVAYEFGATFQTTLNAGDYVVVAFDAENKETETTVTIAAGERTETTM